MGVWLTLVFCLVMIGYILWLISSLLSFRSLVADEDVIDPPDQWPGVSVIVPLRNEEHQIEDLIEDLSSQHYPKERYEIIFVDDHSSPPVREVIPSWDVDISAVRIIELDSNADGKKAALEEGIRQAKGEWIVTTDADTGRSHKWLETMIACALERNYSALAGPLVIRPIRAWIGRFEALEQAILTSLSATGIASGTMPLCSGANFAFRKSFFEEVGAYQGNEVIASGDDVFLMQKFLERDEDRCGYVLNHTASVYTPSHQNIVDYIRQRSRWAGKNRAVGNSLMSFQGSLPYIANGTIVIGMIAWLLGVMSPVVLFGLFFFKAMLETLWSQEVFRRVTTDSIPVSTTIIKSVLYPFFSFLSLILMLINRLGKQEWKGRSIRSVR